MRLILLALLACAGCTEITTYYPVCENTTVDLAGNALSVDTLSQPDSACIARFKEKMAR